MLKKILFRYRAFVRSELTLGLFGHTNGLQRLPETTQFVWRSLIQLYGRESLIWECMFAPSKLVKYRSGPRCSRESSERNLKLNGLSTKHQERMRLVRRVRLFYQLVMCLVATVLPLGVKAAGHDSHSGAPVPPEILERAIGLRAGTGSARQKVTTSSLRAQAFYDQGLAYLHSFVWVEAARSFHQSLRV